MIIRSLRKPNRTPDQSRLCSGCLKVSLGWTVHLSQYFALALRYRLLMGRKVPAGPPTGLALADSYGPRGPLVKLVSELKFHPVTK